jgi:hypothetical protein
VLQFRLRTLFILTAAVALLAWILFAPPQWVGMLAIYLLHCLLPAAIVAGIIYHRGYWQAFFIGAATWVGLTWAWTMSGVPTLLGSRTVLWTSAIDPFSDDIFMQLFSIDPGLMIYQKFQLAVPIVITIGSGLVAVGVRWWALRAARRSSPDS